MRYSMSSTNASLPINYGLLLSKGINEDASNKSFLIKKYIDFKMDDSKPIIDQVNEFNDIASQCADVGEPIF